MKRKTQTRKNRILVFSEGSIAVTKHFCFRRSDVLLMCGTISARHWQSFDWVRCSRTCTYQTSCFNALKNIKSAYLVSSWKIYLLTCLAKVIQWKVSWNDTLLKNDKLTIYRKLCFCLFFFLFQWLFQLIKCIKSKI